MRKLMAVVTIAVAVLMSTGCTKAVPPGYVAKVIGTAGVHPEIHETGRVHINPFSRNRLVLIETASELRPAPVNVIMADPVVGGSGEVENRIGLDMDFILNVRYRLRSDDEIITAMLRDMKLDEDVSSIGIKQVYNKYGNMVVGRVSREVLSKYAPEQVLPNLEDINAILDEKIKAALESSPLVVSSVSLGPIKLPEVITDRVRLNKDTELSEAQKRTEQQIALLDKQNEIELAKQQAVRERVDAQSLAEQNRILNASVTPEVLRLRELQIEEKRIEMQREVMTSGLQKGNSSVFIPYGAMDSAGAQMRMFQK